MRTNLKRSLSVLLTLVMLVGLLPTAALAASGECSGGTDCTHEATIGTTHYDTLTKAVSAAGTDGVGIEIVLLKDIELQEQLKINKEITLDLNNKTITATNTGYASARTLNITSPVTIENGALIDTVVSTSKSITMTNVIIKIVDDTTDKGSTANALHLSGGSSTATLTNCNLSLTTTRGSASTAISINWTAENSTITMNGGSLRLVKNDGSGYGAGAVYTTAGNLTITLNGVDVVYEDNSNDYSALNFGSNGGTLTVNGGRVTATNVDGTESRDALYAGWNKSSTVNVEGDAVINGKIGFAGKGTAVPKINIKGGTFTDEALIRTTSEESDPSASLVVTGGKFADSVANREALTAAGVVFVEGTDGLVGVDVSARVAKVGEAYYNDFASAVTAANATAIKEIVIVGAVDADIATITGLVIKSEGANAKLTVAVADGTLKEQIASVFGAVTLENAALVELKHGTDVVATFGDITVRGRAVVSGAISTNAMDKEGYYYHPTLFTLASSSGYLSDDTISGDVLGKHKIVEYGAGTKYIVGVAIEHDGVAYYRVYNKLNDALQFAISNDNATTQVNDLVVLFTDYSDIANYYVGGETFYVSNVGTGYDYATFTLDLGGYTWSSEKQSEEDLVYMLAITANNTDVTVKNGTITGTNAVYGITTNGTFRNTNLTLEDLTLNVPNGSGMYLPASGNVTMTSVNINAKSVGVQTCAADITLDNCKITTGGDDRAAQKENGDGLIPDGAAISVVNRPGYKATPSVTITSGTFNTKNGVNALRAYTWDASKTGAERINEWSEGRDNVLISGGIFSHDPSAYCVSGKTGVQNTDSATNKKYPFMVADKKNPTISTESKKESASVSISEDVADDHKAELEAVSSALTGADVVTGSGLDAAVATQVDNNTITASALDDTAVSAIVSDSKPKEALNIVVQYYMDVTLKEVKTEAGSSKTLTVDITPMVQTVATTATGDEDIKLEDSSAGANDKNAVVVKPAEKLTITSPVTVTLPLPADFADVGDKINIQHNHSTTGKTYVYTATVKADSNNKLYVSFVNPNGFSEFILGVAAPVAKIGDVGYKSLQDAVEAVENDETIILQKGIDEESKIYVARTVKFTLDTNSKQCETDIVEGQYTELTYDEFTNTYSFVYTAPVYTGGGSSAATYSIETAKTENGSVGVSPKSAAKGKTVTITATPDKGYELDSLTALDKDGKEVKLTEKNGKYTFEMPASKVTVKATFKKLAVVNPFVDVKNGDYFYGAVLWAVGKGVTSGTSATTFSPNEPCTRGQIVTFLWRAAGSPEPKNAATFSDVSADAYYAKAVAWAVENGITVGTSDTTFSPDETCTRAQAVTFLSRALKGKAAAGSAFSDVAANSYYAEAVAWAAENGITSGTSATTFSPDEVCTRGQIVTLLFRAMAE